MASASEADAPDWAALPFSAVALIVAHASCLPRHQSGAALSALRLANRHWRSAVDDSIRSWHLQPYIGAPHNRVAAVLRRWQHLEALTLSSCVVDEAALQALGRCRRLSQLSFTHFVRFDLPGAAAARRLWEVVAALPALQLLTVHASDEGPTPAGLAALAGCSSLTALELHDFHREDIAIDVVAVLRGATRIQHLALHRSVRATAVQAQQAFDIGFATQLTSLELRASFTHDDDFLGLFATLTSLRRLDISANRNLTDDGFLGITRLAACLTALVMEGGHSVTENGATALAASSGLQMLSLAFSNRMSSDALLPLVAGTLTQLTSLNIQGCARACSPAAFGALSTLTSLRQLVARDCRLQQSAVAALAHLTNLQMLCLSDNTALSLLDQLTCLRGCMDLDVSDCELEDHHLVRLLASLPQLRNVNISSNPHLTAAGLEALAAGPARTTLQSLEATSLRLDWETVLKLLPQFKALESINLSGNEGLVDPTALLLAAEAAPSLHTIWVVRVNLQTADGLDSLAHSRHDPGRRRLLLMQPWDSQIAAFA
ncbi:leucine-rich repeat-containing G- coupled receptor 4-like [Chlorella sorokiniana]|uniref:Leucine-rich repeat-containing G-coupled receptor 4-like n=1 Tax=Chlorella sorokiniana TaxID=3076 RepID=A0A2P6TBE6_CHLSO|nr:leucine-rich repeat-containing G- coupled receptor 4-like [Chlorella sorokiniana]|eukprot:PRW05869.1 leucine-rich repeat-containing G- coupled receptor 4-like [Chlorella sorokiniana]